MPSGSIFLICSIFLPLSNWSHWMLKYRLGRAEWQQYYPYHYPLQAQKHTEPQSLPNSTFFTITIPTTTRLLPWTGQLVPPQICWIESSVYRCLLGRTFQMSKGTFLVFEANKICQIGEEVKKSYLKENSSKMFFEISNFLPWEFSFAVGSSGSHNRKRFALVAEGNHCH